MEDTAKHDWLRECLLPDSTELQERLLKTDQDIVIGDRCQIDYGLEGKDIVVCEFCKINGNILASGDVRIDNWCDVAGNVLVDEDAYLGEGVRIRGKLVVHGDLDLGDNVQIEQGFEAKGWISIRNPLPVIAYIMLYLVALLGIEKEEELESVMNRLFGDEDVEKASPLMIPAGAVMNMQTITVPDSMTIGTGCRLHGNIKAGSVTMLKDVTLFGSLQSRGAVSVAEGCVVHGGIRSDGDVTIPRGVRILGDVVCKKLTLHEEARVDGTIRAPDGLKIERN
ncbi:acyltransferase [Methanoculleus sp. FWC-SCC1]|uniref:Acyltransferase n=1 Tax=Methanoculleus frigidifontis TaxID=2584085 RepID=A0ABT8M9E1_9EURY|nr:polymer-forming cytoskeletal protein [Methanoculleus sp. FWC-SCC1]MDN7024543.1 acyltransferase [Methanoculleus sp. FWC-SCC1]